MRGIIQPATGYSVLKSNYAMKGSVKVEEYNKMEPLKPTVSEYKFGYTTFIVEAHFNLECSETLEDILKRLMISDAEELLSEI